MNAKSIIIKSNTGKTIKQLYLELFKTPSIRFNNLKVNGESIIIIKCFNYYDNSKIEKPNNIYGNYAFLYTFVSLILTDLIINNYEELLVNRILHYNYFYLKKERLSKISNIVSLILNPNSPLESNGELLAYRKQLILSSLLKNFRVKNYIHVDGFINFSLQSYNDFLEELIYNVIQLSISKLISIEELNLVIKNMFDY